MNEILSLAIVVAAYVGVAKGYGMPNKHNHALAIFVAAVFLLVPAAAQDKMLMISLVGLTATGGYQIAKAKVSSFKDGSP